MLPRVKSRIVPIRPANLERIIPHEFHPVDRDLRIESLDMLANDRAHLDPDAALRSQIDKAIALLDAALEAHDS